MLCMPAPSSIVGSRGWGMAWAYAAVASASSHPVSRVSGARHPRELARRCHARKGRAAAQDEVRLLAQIGVGLMQVMASDEALAEDYAGQPLAMKGMPPNLPCLPTSCPTRSPPRRLAQH